MGLKNPFSMGTANSDTVKMRLRKVESDTLIGHILVQCLTQLCISHWNQRTKSDIMKHSNTMCKIQPAGQLSRLHRYVKQTVSKKTIKCPAHQTYCNSTVCQSVATSVIQGHWLDLTFQWIHWKLPWSLLMLTFLLVYYTVWHRKSSKLWQIKTSPIIKNKNKNNSIMHV